MTKEIDYWKIRSTKYDQLQWVNNKDSIQALLDFSLLEETDRVLDLGCGTGVISWAMVNKVEQIFAVDKSADMLEKFKPDCKNIHVGTYDIECDHPLLDEFFEKIIARMVFHHISDLKTAFTNCVEMLAPEGMLIIQEGGVLPEKEGAVRRWYADMMKLKEDRRNFSVEELTGYFKTYNFKNISSLTLVDKGFSIGNWLSNSGQPKPLQDKIYDLHKKAPKEIKDFYNMQVLEDDILIDSKTFLIRGEK